MKTVGLKVTKKPEKAPAKNDTKKPEKAPAKNNTKKPEKGETDAK